METPSLLDTDILSELFKGNNFVRSRASKYIHQYNQLTISQIAKDANKQIESFILFCEANVIIQITDNVIIKAANIFANLRKQGITISDANILVAAMAITNNLTLITNNIKHFTLITELQLDNWKS